METMRSFLFRHRYRLLAAFLLGKGLFLVVPVWFANLHIPRIHAEDGILDLTETPFSLTGPFVPLQGEWEYYPDRILTPGDWGPGQAPTNAGVLATPFENTLKEAYESGVYRFSLRMVILLPLGMDAVGISIPAESFSRFTLWGNGKLLFTNIEEGSGRAVARSYPAFAIADAGDGVLTILLQCELLYPASADFLEVPVLGTPAIVGRVDGFLGFMRTFLFASLLVMAFYHCGLYFFRNRTDRAPLYYAAFCLVLSLSGGESQAHLGRIVGGLDPLPLFMIAVIAAMFLTLNAYTGFIASFFPGMVSERIRRLISCSCLIMTAAALASLLAPPGVALSVSLLLSLLFIPVVLFSLGYFALVLFRALHQDRADVWLIFAGSLLLAITIVNDLLNELHLVHTVPFLIPLGLFAFTLAQSLAVAWRFARALRNEEELSRNLERKVETRTAELEEERSRLAVQNEAVARDLALARRIQSRFIPAEAPHGIAFWYRPMVEIGGDFFDFVVEENAVSFLISDVSGHGVAAAFVTSLIKGFTHEHAGLLADPAAFLARLNDFLGPLTAGNFVTACVCRYERLSRSLTLASAGHNPPWLVGPSGTQAFMTGRAGLPLAVLPGKTLSEMGKGYRNASTVLPPGGKLLLYTDGLTEAIPFGEGRTTETADFETVRMAGLLEGLADSPARAIVRALVDGLVAFRGADSFDDDVCLVCFEPDAPV